MTGELNYCQKAWEILKEVPDGTLVKHWSDITPLILDIRVENSMEPIARLMPEFQLRKKGWYKDSEMAYWEFLYSPPYPERPGCQYFLESPSPE